VPCRTLVTALARSKVVSAKGALTVVASGATGSTSRCVMIERQGRRHLPPARQTCPDLVTGNTRQFLGRIVTSMTETNAISRRLLGGTNQSSELMTSAARGDVLSVCLSVGRMTAKTSDVRIQTRRNRETNTTSVSPVTRSTSSARMSRVIELNVETAQGGKRFDLSTLHVCVTDSADRTRGV
jgi:hypothetical protein